MQAVGQLRVTASASLAVLRREVHNRCSIHLFPRWLHASSTRNSVQDSPPPTFTPPDPSTLPRTIFSGIQPTGVPHLGNYLGALREWVKIQNTARPDDKLVYCIVDLHALTQPQNPDQLRQWKREAMAILLAIGLNMERSIIFEQSKVPAHSELMWMLSCNASVGGLNRMTQWKSKLSLTPDQLKKDAQSQKSLKLGLFAYPVLQAADILVYSATHVPVGADQVQHLELTRDLAQSFNHFFGPTFPLPEIVLSPAKRVMSLRDPAVKMSKSDPDARSRILLTDTPEEIRAKFKIAMTDSWSGVSYDPVNRPGVSNLVEIYAHMEGREDFVSLAEENKSLMLKDFKERVAECIVEGLAGIRAEFRRVMEEGPAFLDAISQLGADRAQQSAKVTLVKAKKAMGLL